IPPATPASILSSVERRSSRAAGWSVMVVDPVSVVAVFMVQGCRPRVPPSIGINPGRILISALEGIRVNPGLRSGLFGVAGVLPGFAGLCRGLGPWLPGPGPDAVAAEGRLEQVERAGGLFSQHGTNLFAGLPGQAEPAGLGGQHA